MSVNKEYVRSLIKQLGFSLLNGSEEIWQKKYSGEYGITINFDQELIDYENNNGFPKICVSSKTTSNFSQQENFVVLECVNRLLEKGYKPECIELEHSWPSGHGTSGRLDIMVKKDNKAYLMIECKTYGKEFEKEKSNMLTSNKDGESKGQLFSYCWEEKSTEYLCLYASYLKENKIIFENAIIQVEEEWKSLSNKKELFDLIFKDLEISMIRIGNWYEKKISGENPDILKQQKEIMDAATQRLGRSNFSVMMSNWLVAPDLIDRPKEKGATLKRNNEGKYMYKEFGEWCRMTLKAYQEADMSPDYLSMMNEPDGDNSAGTKIRLGYGIDDSQKANYGKALDATYEAFKEVSKRPKLIGPEVLGIGYGTFSNYYRDLNPDLLDAAAFHCYHGGKTSDYKDNDRYSSAHAFKTEFQNIVRQVGNKSIMMTENCSYHPAVPEDAVNIAHFISNSFRYANATVYLHWALLWGYADADELKKGGDGCIAVEWPWSSSRWTTEKGYVVRSEFYGLKHFTKYVKPGWRRIGVDYELKEVEVVAFQDPDEYQIAVVLVNYSEQEEKTVRLENIGSKEVSSIRKVIQTDTQKESWYQELKNTDPFVELVLPKMSVTTVYFKFKTN